MNVLHHRRHTAPTVRYAVYDESSRANLASRPFILRDSAGEFVDAYRSFDCAAAYCRALNAGRADLQPHAVIGCRVQVRGY